MKTRIVKQIFQDGTHQYLVEVYQYERWGTTRHFTELSEAIEWQDHLRILKFDENKKVLLEQIINEREKGEDIRC